MLIASGAGAQLYVWPRIPTNQDELVVEARTPWGCASLVPGGVTFREDGVIRVLFDDGSRVICSVPNTCPMLVNLGRVPPGTYTLELAPDRPSFAVPIITQFTVNESRLPGDYGYRALRRRLPPECL
ncbi:hypothetical protein DSM104443_01718 [Usitatibacter rugosus]|uniref:Uncharacterized protein n=2 Tax=Usitatibacter rugosus TaxID=2732067 RepID=A0A6M4GTM5_9PROT|nr:hypothetical protein DSM104443_01718 [Usitatibacter rugosus]